MILVHVITGAFPMGDVNTKIFPADQVAKTTSAYVVENSATICHANWTQVLMYYGPEHIPTHTALSNFV